MIKQSGNKFFMVLSSIIGVFLLVVAEGWESSRLVYAQSADCCAQKSTSRKDGSGLQNKQGSNDPASRIDYARTSFYAVPLVCGAAPEIGCGSRSKPILKELEQHEAISAVWLNRTGTVIAVQWTENSTPIKRAEAITTIAKKSDLSMLELSDDKREAALKEFAQRLRWYRSSEVDRLSEEEGDIIGARLVRRIRVRITLSDKQAGVLAKALADAFKRIILGLGTRSGRSREEEFLSAGRKHLSEENMAVLKQALSLGLHPQPGEK